MPGNKSALQTVLESLENDMDINVRDYSGRGMYGKKCLAFVTNGRYPNLGSMFGAILRHIVDTDMNRADIDEIADSFDGMSSDSMGLGMVYYFEEVEYVDEKHD